MAYQVELEFAAKTDTGMVRPQNEDSVAVSASCGFALLADGMGGYNGGEVASGIATAVLKQSLEQQLQTFQWSMGSVRRSKHIQQLVVESILQANASIVKAAQIEPQYAGMGTTLVAALFHQDKVTVAHVGDSRAYRFRNGQMVQITRDHSVLQEQIDAGLITEEEAQFAHNKNLVTRAMGVDYGVEVEIHDHLIEVGDIYLLCSDGLSDMLSPQEILETMTDMEGDLNAACDMFVQRANDHGGRDNISIILTRILSINSESESTGWFGRILNRIK